MPVLSLSVFPDAMFGEERGIFPNILKSCEIPVSIEFFETDQKLTLSENAGARLSGQASFNYPKNQLLFQCIIDLVMNNALSWPSFDGYVIYRSEGNVLDWTLTI